jgi:maleate isomerase
MTARDVTTKIVSDEALFAEPAARHRLGLIALSTDVTIEADFHRLLPDDVMFHTARVVSTNPITIENLQTMGPQLAAAAAILAEGHTLDAIAYGCTSATVAMGYEEIAERIGAGRAGPPVTTPITAALKAFELFKVRKISMLTPYIDSVNQPMRGFLEDAGITVLNISAFGLESDIDMCRVSPDAIRRAAIASCAHEADALFVSCTALRAVEVIESLEADLDRPVFSSNQCLFWNTVRRSGYRDPIPGYGRLLLA